METFRSRWTSRPIWKHPDGEKFQKGTQTGFVAQEVEKVFPEWVGKDDEGFKTLDLPYREIVTLQIEAIRTLKADNDDLRKHVKALEDGHPIQASTGFNFGGANVGLLGLAAAIAYATSRRRKQA